MRRALLLLLLGGCYAPKVAEGVACAPAGTDRCPAGQVCVTRAGVEVCEPAGATSDPDAAVDSVPADAAIDGAVPAGWWNPAYKHRRAIDVRAGSLGAQDDYTLALTFDHASLVAAGDSLASGDDVRIVREDGTQAPRMLDSGSAWNGVATKLWFRNPNGMQAGATARFWLYWGNPLATLPPTTPSGVFLFADDFESGLDAWTLDAGVVATTARSHRGSKSLQIGPLAQVTTGAYVSAVDERNLAFDVWCYIDDTAGVDAYAGFRGNSTEQYFTNLQPAGNGASKWDISRNLSGTYEELVPPPSGAAAVVANRWTRVTLYAYETQMAIDVDGQRYVPAAGFATVPDVISGNVGVGGYTVASHVWFDDASVRRFVTPEPTVLLGPTESLP